MYGQALPGGTVTFLFTDIEGSTRLLQRLGDEYAQAIADQRLILRAVFEKYHGREIDDHLSLFGYESNQPVDTIPIKDLSSLHTVIYDDKRVPHIDVIDSAAQALQISITKQDQPVTFLLRSMLKVRPIDWYHAIEKARFTLQIK